MSYPLAGIVMSSLCVCQVHWPVLLCHHCVCHVHWPVLLCHHCMCVRSVGWCCYVIVCVSGPLAGVVTSSLCVSGPLAGVVDVKLKLPPGLTCTQCVLQWKWHAGEHPPPFWLCSLSQGLQKYKTYINGGFP